MSFASAGIIHDHSPASWEHMGLISWFRALNLNTRTCRIQKPIPFPSPGPIHLPSYPVITRSYRCILCGISFVSSREQREFPAKRCWNMIIDVYYLGSTLPIEYRPWLLLRYCSLWSARTKMRHPLKCSNSTLCWLSLSWRVICSKAELHWQYRDERECKARWKPIDQKGKGKHK